VKKDDGLEVFCINPNSSKNLHFFLTWRDY